MSFCSGLLEGAAIYLFAGKWYGDVGLNITAVRELARARLKQNKQGECCGSL
jgi:hypothetical protein